MRGLLGGRRGEESGAKERENGARSNCGNVERGIRKSIRIREGWTNQRGEEGGVVKSKWLSGGKKIHRGAKVKTGG